MSWSLLGAPEAPRGPITCDPRPHQKTHGAWAGILYRPCLNIGFIPERGRRPRAPREATKKPQETPKMRQDAPQEGPRCPKRYPRGLQESPKRPLRGPRRRQAAPANPASPALLPAAPLPPGGEWFLKGIVRGCILRFLLGFLVGSGSAFKKVTKTSGAPFLGKNKAFPAL